MDPRVVCEYGSRLARMIVRGYCARQIISSGRGECGPSWELKLDAMLMTECIGVNRPMREGHAKYRLTMRLDVRPAHESASQVTPSDARAAAKLTMSRLVRDVSLPPHLWHLTGFDMPAEKAK